MKGSPAFTGVCLVGASAAGKSTVVRRLRERFPDHLTFPIRYVTRASRVDDDDRENRSVSLAEFEALWESGNISLRWEKPLPGDTTVHYGFQRTSGNHVVLSGNSDLVMHRSLIRPSDALNHVNIILVRCENTIRLERLRMRDPRLIEGSPEWAKRTMDESSRLAKSANLTVDTTHGISDEDLDAVFRLARGRQL